MIQIKFSKILIIGSGPSGYSASLYLSRANLNPILLTGKDLGGQLIKTNKIENWPSLEKLKGSDLMNKIFCQIKNLNTEIIFDEIYKTNILVKPVVLFGKINNYFCNILIISSGSNPKYLSIKNEKKYLGYGISNCAICDGNFYKNKIVLLIGGGNSSIENVMFLLDLAKKIFFIHRKNFFNVEFFLLKNFFEKKFKKNIILKLNMIAVNIIGDDINIKYVKIKNIINFNINIIYINGLFLSIGNIANSNMFVGQLKIYNKHIVTKFTKYRYISLTNFNGVFSSGDVQDIFYKQAIISSSNGCISALDSISYYNKLNFF